MGGAGEDELRAASGAASGDGCAGSRPTTVLGATMGFDPGGGEGRRGGPTRWRLVAAGTGDAGEACGGDGRGVGVVRSRSDLDREGERVGGASG